MCNLLQIKKTRTTPYHPQSDGMVERFNRTLVTMLSTFVEDHHRDWDEHLPYVMMAYRSCEHETTGMSPNMLMLGREVQTPLDLAYQMPPSVKKIPAHEWAWKLRENMENAHTFVRFHTGQEMKRQKRYHDLKLSFEKFVTGDEVYVYFPVKKVGQSSKLSSFWKGPFKVLSQVSNVLYKVDCGRKNEPQIVHCDRLRKRLSQNLSGEQDILEQNESDDNSVEVEMSGPLVNIDTENVEKRVRRPPVCVFFVCCMFTGIRWPRQRSQRERRTQFVLSARLRLRASLRSIWWPVPRLE